MAGRTTNLPLQSPSDQEPTTSDRFTQLTDLNTQLAALEAATLAEMRERWAQISDKPVPKVRRTLLRLALAWEMQAAVHGGLPKRTEQRLSYLAGKLDPVQTTLPGMRLVREWNGVLHTVTIGADGEIHWQDKTWRSLSEVARAITGTRWSGPVFFGLKQRRVA